jgi:AmmeMemoRadiSam system protein B
MLVAIGTVGYSRFLIPDNTVSLSRPAVRGISDTTVVTDTQRPVHPLYEFDEQLFLNGLRLAEQYDLGTAGNVAGGVIPHHNLPSHLLSGFFASLANKNLKTIILVGPNHRELGDAKVITSRYNWQGQQGVVLANQHVIDALVKSGAAAINEGVISQEHSITTIVPFIDYHLADATIVPLILKRGMNQKEIDNLAQQLSRFVGEDTMVVAPVDFSHYLSANQAEEKDQESLAAMRGFDMREILAFNNDHMDSPPSIAVLLATMQRLGATTLSVLDHTNSGRLFDNYIAPVTSYFVLTFSQ